MTLLDVSITNVALPAIGAAVGAHASQLQWVVSGYTLAFGAIGTVVGVATAVGPVAGGGLIALGGPHLGWRLVFFVNVPIGLVTIVLARRWLPPPVPSTRRRHLDVPGAALLGAATFVV